MPCRATLAMPGRNGWGKRGQRWALSRMNQGFRVFEGFKISGVMVSVTRVTDACRVTLVMLGERMGVVPRVH